MLGQPVHWQDLENLDPDHHKGLRQLLEYSLDDLGLSLTFTIDLDRFGEKQTVELRPGGADQDVTDENKQEYVQLVAEYKMTHAIKPQLDAFLQGFHDIVPSSLLGSLFDDKELELLISGLPTIDIADLKANTEYVNYLADSPQIKWFWATLEDHCSPETLAQFLQFVTGSSQVPLDGFQGLAGMNGPQRFSIHKAFGSERLPTAHTCFNQLDLPEYSSEELLRKKLLQAITEAHQGFGFA
jgi:E3 ubiquitin-protein ligase HUWE1